VGSFTRRVARRTILLGLLVSLCLSSMLATVRAQGTPAASPVVVADPAAVDAFLQTPVGQQAAWVIAALNGEGEQFTQELYATRFDPSFIRAVPFDKFLPVAAEVAAAGPWEVVSVAPGATDLAATVTIQGTGTAFDLVIGVDETPEHRITTLAFQPGALRGWADVDAALAAIGPSIGLLAAEITGTGCSPVHTVGGETVLAIGSVFKLYILGELGRQVAAGERAWDDLVEIQDAYRSLPSGDLAFAPAGTRHTLRYLAEVMISQSDNTATDHLLFTLGRENVEAMVATMGHNDPSLFTPFLSTREAFALKAVLTPDRQQAYIAAGPEARSALLNGEVTEAANGMVAADVAGFVEPTLIDEIEWFASPNDLCNAMAYLLEQSALPGGLPVLEILTLNPGLPLNRMQWPTIGFKGGSEPGVLNLTWLLQKPDGRWFVISLGANDPTKEIDQDAFLQMASLATTVLAQETS
jgi:hypothetical protein